MFPLFASRQAAASAALLIVAATPAWADGRHHRDDHHGSVRTAHTVQLGPRPFFLVEDMQDGKLKRSLQQCANGPFRKRDFSIGHRGAAMQFPEHTHES